jgi:hypothetical protein
VQGISLDVEGTFSLQLSAKSTGLFESFYSQLKPIVLIKEQKVIAGEGRVTDKELNEKNEKKFPFSFLLKVAQQACDSPTTLRPAPPRLAILLLTHCLAARFRLR